MAAIEKITTNEITPKPTLTVIDAIAVIVGIVIGSGIFKTPSLVASNAGSENLFLILWPIGGFISFIGALCYAELSSTYPHAGGDYYYIKRAFGQRLSFLYAWARLVIIQTGSIAALSYVFGDYATQIFSLGDYSSAIYASLSVILLSALHSRNIHHGTIAQKLLVAAKVIGLIFVIVVGLTFIANPAVSSEPSKEANTTSSIGLALVFVLFTYGGWNEVSFITAEMKDVKHNIARALLIGIAVITACYLLTNVAYIKGIGFQGVSTSDVVAADLMRRAIGEGGAKFISFLIAIATLGAASVTIFTGARTNYALGQSFTLFRYVGKWDENTNTPKRALLVQCFIALFLIFLGARTRNGFETMVKYTTPAYWFFLLIAVASLFFLRRKDKELKRPFRVPLYPIPPLIFIATCAYVLYSTIDYAYTTFLETSSKVALMGIIVLLLGIPIMFIGKFER